MLDIATTRDEGNVVLDFFSGSGTTGDAVMTQNSTDGGDRRYICVQLPTPLAPPARLTGGTTINALSDITKERLRRAAKKVKDENPMFAGDLGFRVFKLAPSNIRAWEPAPDDLAGTLQKAIEHLDPDRTEADILLELLLKLGLELTVPIEQKTIAEKKVHSVGAGTLVACLAPQIATAEVESLALGIARWHKELAPAGETTVVFRDAAFADDVAKSNVTAILQQHGLENVRSL
jgi:adenine-specific DNA-methyltransferase